MVKSVVSWVSRTDGDRQPKARARRAAGRCRCEGSAAKDEQIPEACGSDPPRDEGPAEAAFARDRQTNLADCGRSGVGHRTDGNFARGFDCCTDQHTITEIDMAVYRPSYRDKETGELKESLIWWYNFTFAGRRIQESSKSRRKTVAQDAEKKRRQELERAFNDVTD